MFQKLGKKENPQTKKIQRKQKIKKKREKRRKMKWNNFIFENSSYFEESGWLAMLIYFYKILSWHVSCGTTACFHTFSALGWMGKSSVRQITT